jgi:cytoskeletal protein CcmA (bactofilin family)
MFSSERKRPAKPSRADAKGLSFIGPEVTITGDISTSAQLHVDGRITGDVQCAGLCQGKEGAVVGNIVATEARIAGLVDGTVTATSITLESSARVTGDLVYETVAIAAGAQVDGRLTRKPAVESGPKLVTASPVKALPGAGAAENDEAGGEGTELFSPPRAAAS